MVAINYVNTKSMLGVYSILSTILLIVMLILVTFNFKLEKIIHSSDAKLCSIKNNYSENNYKTFIEEVDYPLHQISLELDHLNLRLGGQWAPTDCKPKQRIALIVPYRERLHNLKLFMKFIHPFLSNQNVHYGIYLVEPIPEVTFNRGLLMNIGFVEAIKDKDNNWDCFFMHDVDMLPETYLNTYSCDPKYPKHYAVAVSQFDYRVDGYFAHYFGGITAFTKEQYININGFSNIYFGWGCEDDDLYSRALQVYSDIRRVLPEVGRYYSTGHKKEKPNPMRAKLLAISRENFKKNGITEGITTANYEIRKLERSLFYTRLHVYYNETAIALSVGTKLM